MDSEPGGFVSRASFGHRSGAAIAVWLLSTACVVTSDAELAPFVLSQSDLLGFEVEEISTQRAAALAEDTHSNKSKCQELARIPSYSPIGDPRSVARALASHQAAETSPGAALQESTVVILAS
ncbi:hypothetical protein [Streptomyces sp. NPDC059874]|uniref:hypothetical protein n=1 Tax=Streptomyces sp. NPDC059874 TaxID=3346983 RepID=UPI00364B8A31